MIKGRNNTELDILAANDLCQKLRINNIEYGCLPVSIRALGGAIHFYNILNREAEMTQLFAVDKFDLEIGGFTDIDEPVDAEEIDTLLDWLFNLREGFANREIAGIICFRDYPKNEISKQKGLVNHFFIIFPRVNLSPKVRQTLDRENRYVVVDTASNEPISRTSPEELAEYMNQVLEIGGKFLLIQVFKK